MNLPKLFQLQKNLNDRIEEEHNLNNNSLLPKRILALQVELGELANETRCFKYWSTKGPSDKDTVLEEFVDCLHFILTIGIDKNFYDIDVELIPSESSITDQFLNLYIDINDLVITSSKDHYVTLFEDFISLGNSLGFDSKDIEEAYLKKNTLNHKRQDNGY
ncbi:dUTP diphosphatase [Clostridium frigidicarnis]|uniref:Dimeric dUTPase, all-alpha-NTP-PPase (MazG) superfamily n=1 Tax=Clostridium frigidicarnis TaxID=84698 RepID=A0A1I1AQD9_9CLOT|nr:dUTP diphosphatase [Clostridium frigidicarnis]SFB39626.1 Dimeric dUTPase, all-alpha-NTP-PPase (MazG) superfamily [Clostridium frigidicarnis]